ncbi:MAG: hypothetical protein PHP85_08465 [Gallionella sp.]|nr:hypothetical protein [Gallionella sp.]
MRAGLSLLFILLLAGCASDRHSASGAFKEVIKSGVIESVAPVEMDASASGSSTVGSIFGQVGGASTGDGRGAVAGSVLGSVLGGTLGHRAGINTRPGLELWVRLDDDDQSTYIMQPGKPDTFKVGDRVRVIRKKEGLRVEAAPPAVIAP